MFSNLSLAPRRVPEAPAPETILLSFPNDRPSPARVLVAESNSVNRKVMVQLLLNLGCQVDAVRSGAEAIASARRSKYDFILLDCESPDPNGYEVARTIRIGEGEDRRTPIIALTGAGFETDRKRRLGAGIDDYIAKPIDLHTARAILARWAPELGQTAEPTPTSVEPAVLDGLRRLAGADNPTLIDELVEMFLGSTPQHLADMRRSIREGDSDALAALAHTLKAGSGQLGALRMREICTAIEALSRTGSVQDAAELVDELTVAFDRVSQDLHALRRKSAQTPDLPPAPDDLSLRFEISSIAPVFTGKRILVLHQDPEVLSQVRAALDSTGCELIAFTEPGALDAGWARDASLLFLGVSGGQSSSLAQWRRLRQEGIRVPVIVTSWAPSPVLLQYIEELGGDCILEPLRSEDILFHAYRRLVASSNAGQASARAQDVLVAQEDPLTARFLLASLSANGFRVTQVADGEEALRVLRQKHFGLILLDTEIPTVDGYDVLAALRLEQKHKHTPVLMLSARTQEHAIVRAFEMGADDFLAKPFNPLELVSRARRLVKVPGL